MQSGLDYFMTTVFTTIITLKDFEAMKRAMIVAALMLAANPVSARDNPPSQTTFVSKKWAGSEAWVRGLNPNEKVVVLLAIKAAMNDYIRENLEQSPHVSTQGGAAWVGFTQSYARVGTHKQDSLGVGNVIQPPD